MDEIIRQHLLAREPAPPWNGKAPFALWHFSEDPSLGLFRPRARAGDRERPLGSLGVHRELPPDAYRLQPDPSRRERLSAGDRPEPSTAAGRPPTADTRSAIQRPASVGPPANAGEGTRRREVSADLPKERPQELVLSLAPAAQSGFDFDFF